MENAFRILLCDDQAMVRTSTRRILEVAGKHTIVGEAAGGASAVAMALALQPDLVLMDFNLPDIHGAEATRQIVASNKSIKVLGYSSLQSSRIAEEMISSGAGGYVLKGSDIQELLHAIKVVMTGGLFMSQALNDCM